jgi:hypothetical protein
MLSALTALALTITLNLEQALVAPEIFQSSNQSPLSLDLSVTSIDTDMPQILDVTDYFKRASAAKLNQVNDWLRSQTKLAMLGRVPVGDDLIYELEQRYPIICGQAPDGLTVRPWMEQQPADPEFDYPLFESGDDGQNVIHPLFRLDRDRAEYRFPNVCRLNQLMN